MQGNILSPILCNIYLHELDKYIINDLTKKYTKGEKPLVNNDYRKFMELKSFEKKLPSHILNTIKRSKRRQANKLGIKRILESEEFVRIKYVRYVDDFIIGIRGSKNLADKICVLVKNFLSSCLSLKLNMDKTRITDTYSNKAKFLGMVIFNKKSEDLPYRKSRAIENTKRTFRKNKVKKEVKRNQALKQMRNKLIKSMGCPNSRVLIKNISSYISKNTAIRSKLRKLSELLYEFDHLDNNDINTKTVFNKHPNMVKLVPVNRIEIMHRVRNCLLKYNAMASNRAVGKRV
jgi:hypothetical protein